MEVGWKSKDQLILLYEVFSTFAVLASQKLAYSTDNSKVSTFLYSNMFKAVVAFLLIWMVASCLTGLLQ